MFSQRIVLSKDLLGCQKNISLYEDDRVRVCEDIKQDDFVVGSEGFHVGELFDIAPTISLEIDHPFSSHLFESYRAIYGDRVDWFRALGKNKFVLKVSDYLKSLKKDIESKDRMNYLNTIKSGREVLGSLQRINIDRDILKNKLLNRDTSNIRSLIPLDDGLCEVVRYSHESQTGRMIVKSGPKVLLLSKEDREVFIASDKDKLLCQVDFVSLEPRVTYLLQNSTSPKDIYEFMGKTIGADISRAKLKIATISSLYGSTKADSRVSKKIFDFFSLGDISKKYLQDEELHNFYGRPLNSADEYTRLSHFIQSTAVDVALLGFSKFIKEFNVIPYFLIHDSLVFECDKKEYERISKIKDLMVRVDPLGDFYLEFSLFGKDN